MEEEGGQNFHFDLKALHNVAGCGLTKGDYEFIQICTLL